VLLTHALADVRNVERLRNEGNEDEKCRVLPSASFY